MLERPASGGRRTEVVAQVGQAGRAEHGVAGGAGDHVGVGVAVEAELEWDRHPAEDQRAAGDQGVGVDALPRPAAAAGSPADAPDRPGLGTAAGQDGLGDVQVERGGHQVLGIAGHDLDGVAGQLDQGGLVGPLDPVAQGEPVRLLQRLAGEQLRGLHGAGAARGRRCRWSAGRRRPGGWCRPPASRTTPATPARGELSIRVDRPGPTRGRAASWTAT